MGTFELVLEDLAERGLHRFFDGAEQGEEGLVSEGAFGEFIPVGPPPFDHVWVGGLVMRHRSREEDQRRPLADESHTGASYFF